MALENPLVTAAAIEASEYPDLVQRYRITGVPKTVVNDTTEILGLQSELPFIHRILDGLAAERPSDDAPAITE